MTADPDPAAELIAAGRLLVERGLVQASGGNLSVHAGEGMLVTAAGTWLDRLTPDDLVATTFAGTSAGTPSTEWLLHARAYAARPDVHAVLHLHPQTSLLLDALGRRIRFLTQDHAVYVGHYARVPYLPNGSAEIADAVAAGLGAHDVVLMGHHGIAAVGPSVRAALRVALNFEEAALMTYRALLLGDEDSEFPGVAEHR